MNSKQDNDEEKMIFVVTVGDIQQESIRLIGRKLTYDELHIAAKGIDWGLSTDIFTVFRAAIEGAMDLNRRIKRRDGEAS